MHIEGTWFRDDDDGYEVTISDGEYQVDRRTQTLIYRHSTAQAIHQIRVRQPKRH